MRRRGRRAFGLLETLAVIVIVTLLIVLLFPFFERALDDAHRAKCMSNLKSIGSAAHMYAAEHNGFLPGIVSIPASDGAPVDYLGGLQWDVQIMPYLGLGTAVPTSNLPTPFYCPASKRNPAFPISRQLSYAWNSRLTESIPYNSKRQANLEYPSTILLALDSKVVGDAEDKNGVTFGSAGNTIYVNDNLNQLKRVAYERHNERVNVLFADGSVSLRSAVKPPTDNTPQNVRFYNGGPLSR